MFTKIIVGLPPGIPTSIPPGTSQSFHPKLLQVLFFRICTEIPPLNSQKTF